jgi:aminoglycoside phosphotransferase
MLVTISAMALRRQRRIRVQGATVETAIRTWLIDAGWPEDLALTPMRRGLGATELWACSAGPRAPALVVRVFPTGADARAAAECLAMDAAARHGVPVPAIVLRGSVAGRPVVASTFVTGEPANRVLDTRPEDAQVLGVVMGETLGRLHDVVAPEPFRRNAAAWVERGGRELAPIRPLLAAVPQQERLIHLDYHPMNVLIEGGAVSGVIDWENAMAGPPHMDLARTRAILWVARVANLLPPERHAVIDAFERGLVAGHTAIAGPDPHPQLSASWGLAMTEADLAGHLGKPDTFVTPTLLARLAVARQAMVASLQGGTAPPPWA